MKRWHLYALGGLVVALGAAAIAGVRWWQRAHSLRAATFELPTAQPDVPARIKLVPVVSGLEQPTDVQFVPGEATKVVVSQQAGTAFLFDIEAALAGGTPADAKAAPLALKIWARAMGEMGLLSVAFHPRYQDTGKLFVYYHPWVYDTLFSRIAEFELPFAELGKRPGTEKRTLLEVPQEYVMHQGGQVAFGPDGMLYVGFGDGSTANDPSGHAQNLGSLRGKIVRLDVDGENVVPQDNPFLTQKGARPEVWAYGLRNPWRFSFDQRGRVVLGDVGQEGREEIDLFTVGTNLGWKMREGTICAQGFSECESPDFVDPIFDYGRDVGGCVVGGFEVTGTRVPELTGKYVFADFVTGKIWAMALPEETPGTGVQPPKLEPELLGQWPKLFSTFARDAQGDLYVADVATGELLALYPSDGQKSN